MADVQGTHHSQVLLMWYENYFLSFSSSSSSIFIPSSRDSYSHIKEVKKKQLIIKGHDVVLKKKFKLSILIVINALIMQTQKYLF